MEDGGDPEDILSKFSYHDNTQRETTHSVISSHSSKQSSFTCLGHVRVQTSAVNKILKFYTNSAAGLGMFYL